MKWLKGSLIGLAALVIVVAVLLTWLLNAQSGARWIASTASNAMGAKLEIGTVDGTIAGPLTLRDVRYVDPAAGLDVNIEAVSLDLALRELMRMTVRVRDADVSSVRVLLSESTQTTEPAPASEPFTLEPPIDVIVDRFAARDVVVRNAEAPLLEITRAAFAGHWTSADLAVKQLEVQSPQGEVEFTGRVAQGDVYVGEGRGEFRWRVGERTFAGDLTTTAEAEDVVLRLELDQPIDARLDAFLKQADRWPWRFTLEAPRFDPRENLMPGSSIESLAASLSGSGFLDQGVLQGRVVLNGEPLTIETLRFTREPERFAFDAALRVAESEGALVAKGAVQTLEDGWRADVDANWNDVVVPAVWAGQELHTKGQIAFRGNPQKYKADGAVSIGPPQRVADIRFDVNGSTDVVQLSQLDLVQPGGQLAARGELKLKPRIAWSLDATARGFDPGAFAAAWRGNLNFELASTGRIAEEGPSASVRLSDLSGRLRGRRVEGAADLSLRPPLLVAGTMRLSSGASVVRFDGKPGDQIDATLVVDVESLNDWIPEGGGELGAKFDIVGRWPELSIDGRARGRELNAFDARVAALAVDANVDNPLDPKGEVQIDLKQLTAAGFEFTSVEANAAGDQSAHRVTLNATGSPLALELAVEGARTKSGWSGAIEQLVFDVEDAARLALREPVQVTVADGAFDASRACLADEPIVLCAEGAMQKNGALRVRYSLQDVPLSLANAISTGENPLQFAGALQGRGNIERSAAGELSGEALIESRAGGVSRHVAEIDGEASDPQTLFTWNDLRLAANLAGEDARGTLSARLLEKGSLNGELSVRGLGAARSPLSGRVTAQLPDLAPFAVFAPQVANLAGRAEAALTFAGTVQKPVIEGDVAVRELAADVPAVGLHLQNGELIARPAASGDIALEGRIESGEGRMEFAGALNPSGFVEVNIGGNQFLAADIPAARVIVTPDLKFVRDAGRMALSGEVVIPEAAINLQKLPRGGDQARAASSDVVVIDEKTQDEVVEEAPLYADVTIILGEEVELTGFGLQAKLDGRLDVKEEPGEPTVGSGQVRVAGRYKAYGQDLTIREGRLLYANTPLNDPRLNIEATRQVEDVVAGLRVRGSATNPELTVFSDPPMTQANALSYLVAGKPLDDIGADDGEGDALQAATRSLGTAAGGLLAKNLGRRLGVDELAVKDDEMIGGSALTIGQYLSPRLYLSYGVGIFEPGEVVTLRYKLSDDLDVKAQTGPEDTRAGIEYRIER